MCVESRGSSRRETGRVNECGSEDGGEGDAENNDESGRLPSSEHSTHLEPEHSW